MRFLVSMVLVVLASCGASHKQTDERVAFESSVISIQVMGQGPPVVLLPGFGCHATIWREISEALADSYQLHLIEVSGFWSSNPPNPLIAGVVDEVDRYIRSRGLQAPSVIGHSVGGIMAYELAIKRNDAIGTLIILDGVPFLPGLGNSEATLESLKETAASLPKGFEGITSEAFATMMSQTLARGVRDETKLASLRLVCGTPTKEAYMRTMQEVLTTDLRDQISQIHSRILLMIPEAADASNEGRKKHLANYEAQLASASNHEVVVIPEAKHFIMLDQPDLVIAKVTNAINANLH